MTFGKATYEFVAAVLRHERDAAMRKFAERGAPLDPDESQRRY